MLTGDGEARPAATRRGQPVRTAHSRRPCDHGAMRITGAESTFLFAGRTANPLQIMRVTLVGGSDSPVIVRVEGAGVTTPEALCIEDLEAGAAHTAEVPVAAAAPHGPGSALPVTVIAETPD